MNIRRKRLNRFRYRNFQNVDQNGFSKKIKILLLIVFILSVFLLPNYLIKINKIICGDQYGFCNENLVSDLSKSVVNKNLNYTKKILGKEMRSKREIKDFKFDYVFPQTLKINLNIRRPFCSILLNGGESIVIDDTGYSLGVKEGNSVAIKVAESGFDNLKADDKNKVIFACKIYKGLYVDGNIENIEIENNWQQLIIDFRGNIKVIFPLEGDSEVLAGEINLIFSRFLGTDNQDSLVNKIIDLRFENPIIKSTEAANFDESSAVDSISPSN